MTVYGLKRFQIPPWGAGGVNKIPYYFSVYQKHIKKTVNKEKI
jgi:hypothetical protein